MAAAVDLQSLFTRESEQTEWKENVADIDDVVETLCAFANDLANMGGGYVVCGAREEKDEFGFPRVHPVGLTAERLREIEGKVLTRCRERVAPAIAPRVEEVPVVDFAERRILVFIQPATGRAHSFRRGDHGAKHFVRVGRSTIEARNGVLRDLLVRKGELEAWDRRPCFQATVGDINLLVLHEALQRMKLLDSGQSVESYLSATEQLHALIPTLCVREPLGGELRPRNFTVLLFGRQPQRFIPGAFAYFSRYPGRDRATDFAERHEIVGSLFEQALELQRLLGQEASELFDKTNLQSPNTYRYPLRALQEALGNTLAHRDYGSDDPTRITSFSDRVEFLSPGALPTGLTIERIRRGKVPPKWRNQTLAWIFIRLGLAQGEGQGLSTIRRELKAHGCPPPRYEADEARVVCTVRAHPLAAKAEIRSLRQR